MIIYSICENKFVLFANEESVKTMNFNEVLFSLTNLRLRSKFSICQISRLFNTFAFFFSNLLFVLRRINRKLSSIERQ